MENEIEPGFPPQDFKPQPKLDCVGPEDGGTGKVTFPVIQVPEEYRRWREKMKLLFGFKD